MKWTTVTGTEITLKNIETRSSHYAAKILQGTFAYFRWTPGLADRYWMADDTPA